MIKVINQNRLTEIASNGGWLKICHGRSTAQVTHKNVYAFKYVASFVIKMAPKVNKQFPSSVTNLFAAHPRTQNNSKLSSKSKLARQMEWINRTLWCKNTSKAWTDVSRSVRRDQRQHMTCACSECGSSRYYCRLWLLFSFYSALRHAAKAF